MKFEESREKQRNLSDKWIMRSLFAWVFSTPIGRFCLPFKFFGVFLLRLSHVNLRNLQIPILPSVSRRLFEKVLGFLGFFKRFGTLSNISTTLAAARWISEERHVLAICAIEYKLEDVYDSTWNPCEISVNYPSEYGVNEHFFPPFDVRSSTSIQVYIFYSRLVYACPS